MYLNEKVELVENYDVEEICYWSLLSMVHRLEVQVLYFLEPGKSLEEAEDCKEGTRKGVEDDLNTNVITWSSDEGGDKLALVGQKVRENESFGTGEVECLGSSGKQGTEDWGAGPLRLVIKQCHCHPELVLMANLSCTVPVTMNPRVLTLIRILMGQMLEGSRLKDCTILLSVITVFTLAKYSEMLHSLGRILRTILCKSSSNIQTYFPEHSCSPTTHNNRVTSDVMPKKERARRRYGCQGLE
ncbi:hypothetical protein V6N13_148301 [Hibiscus sabdariffa]